MIIYIYSYILKENLIERVFETEVCFWMGGGEVFWSLAQGCAKGFLVCKYYSSRRRSASKIHFYKRQQPHISPSSSMTISVIRQIICAL